ncbi:MAG TPA: MBL fold metallo-hydrolase [Gaiellaceae bacterium]|nr:MBL fold metallo-hydrolase [Gaiellaceae bacterium]
MRLTWIGHSTVVIELDSVRLVTDPVLRDRLNVIRRVSGAAAEVGHVDAVLLSHLHYDHLDLPSLARLGHAVRVFVPVGGAKLLRKRGWTDVVELAEGESTSFRDLEITTTHAEHPGRRSPWSDRAAALGYVVSGSQRVYFAGDTDLFPGMSELAPVDVALLPVAGWGPRVPAGHMNERRAVEALGLLRPRVAVPIHWGTYRRLLLSKHGLREPADTFAQLAAEAHPEVDVRVLPVGGSMELVRA